MRRLSYLVSPVTMVTSLLVHCRLLCGRGLEGSAAAQQRGRRRDLGDVSFKVSFFPKTPACRSVADLAALSLYLVSFSKKRLSTNLATSSDVIGDFWRLM